LIREVLQLRKNQSDLFTAAYKPLYAEGQKAEHLVSFMRGQRVLVLAPRLVLGLNNDWFDTTVFLEKGAWRNILTNEKISGGRAVSVKELLGMFPVGLLLLD
jgi:(1->4)-alpha-D-glucan 1-alpha-D-glucosylmutase